MSTKSLNELGNGVGLVYITDVDNKIIEVLPNEYAVESVLRRDGLIRAPFSTQIRPRATVVLTGGTGTITNITVDGVSVFDTSSAITGATVQDLAANARDAINSYLSTPNYTAISVNDTFYIYALDGVGESGRCFIDAFEYLSNCSVVVPDLLGFGKSEKVEKNSNYSFAFQMQIIWELISHFGLKDIILVGHSYGGILATLMCQGDKDRKIKKFVNIEGIITKANITISTQAVSALKQYNNDMKKFGHWLQKDGFKKIVLEDMESSATIHYFDSVMECDPLAFAQTAQELCDRFEIEDEEGVNEISTAYKRIEIPKVYCRGSGPSMEAAKHFLDRNNLKSKEFMGASHWVMLDNREAFYSFLEGFITA